LSSSELVFFLGLFGSLEKRMSLPKEKEVSKGKEELPL
jgi:hypothetical protein